MNLRHLLLALVATATLALNSRAAELADLGEGLNYLRFRPANETATAELTFALNNGRALVVDLRYVSPDAETARTVASALAARTTRQPLFLLVSPGTAAELLPARLPAGALTLGIAGAKPAPQVVVSQAAEADRRAFDALEQGMDLAALVNGKTEKERFDEAQLVKEFKSGNPNAEPPPEPDPTAKPAKEKVPVLTDRVLQRAIHLHRALAALDRRAR